METSASVTILPALFIAAYIAGAINCAIVAFRLAGRPDPRERFSGNPGVTNVHRQAGPAWAALVLLLDLGRSLAVALAAARLLPAAEVPWVGLALVLGNRFPCFHRFRGGKGVAAYLGFMLGIAPLSALTAMAGWVAAYGLWRQPFIGSFVMVGILTGAGIAGLGGDWGGSAALGAISVLIVAGHRENLHRWRHRHE